MHILMIPSWYPSCPTDVSGVFFRDQALALHEAGNTVGVIAIYSRSLVRRPSFRRRKVAYEVDNGVYTHRATAWQISVRLPYIDYVFWRRAAFDLVRDYIAKHGLPDVVHAHSAIYAGLAASDIGKKLNIPVVLTEHNSSFLRNSYRRWQRELAIKSLRDPVVRIAVSRSFAADLEALFKSEWLFVPNLVSDRFIRTDFDHAKPRRTLRFLNVGGMNKNKGQEVLIRAFALFHAQNTEAELWVVGDGVLRSHLIAVAEECGVVSHVRLLGEVRPDRMPSLFADVDVTVVASFHETFSLVAAESLTMGVPVISTRCGGPESVVMDGDGLLVSCGNIQQLATAMAKMEGFLMSFDAFSVANAAKDRFGRDAVVNQLDRIYTKLVSKADGGSVLNE